MAGDYSWLLLKYLFTTHTPVTTDFEWAHFDGFYSLFIKYTTKTRWGEQEEGILEGEVRRPEKRNAAIHCKNELYFILKRECAPQMKKVMRMRKGVHYVWWHHKRKHKKWNTSVLTQSSPPGKMVQEVTILKVPCPPLNGWQTWRAVCNASRQLSPCSYPCRTAVSNTVGTLVNCSISLSRKRLLC